MMWMIIGIGCLVSIYAIVVLERRLVYKTWEFGYPVAAFASYFIQENVKPRKRDKTFYETAPILFITVAVLAIGIFPWAESSVIANMATGALFFNAALAYIMVALVMAGWAPNAVYPMIGGWRFMGQLIAYSMPIVMAITATVMRAESMNMMAVVESQTGLWNIVYQPVGFLLFYAASLALTFLPPFDLPNAPGELEGGVFAEFTGTRLLIFRLGRIILIFSLSLGITHFFLGGWAGPFLPGYVWVFLKTILVACSFFVVGNLLPRFRHDHTLEWSWKLATPLALFNILWVGILLLL
ncbi:NADH dehydrogenase subunit H [Salegentibacter echinorum]|uniref:NADH dehydrogenase subunit H n=1 Tax=Salegentibacter echinorum TaxID=1073325 RepID=A0A1M5BKS9_SALEC|nr:complex I subunit 1 family protein [Salegentibacter echinorum]SHF42960.1 NADH dehydrogenase subunit H [Salegentibacter echinorum]